jgi:hypothetical protein
MESLNIALATSFDVDPQRIARTPTDLEIDHLECLGSAKWCCPTVVRLGTDDG